PTRRSSDLHREHTLLDGAGLRVHLPWCGGYSAGDLRDQERIHALDEVDAARSANQLKVSASPAWRVASGAQPSSSKALSIFTALRFCSPGRAGANSMPTSLPAAC